jgi:hypothetical protein
LEAEERVEEERRRREEEDIGRQRAIEEKVKRLEGRREALRAARTTLAGEFRAKTIAKEEFRVRNAEIALEWRELDEEERGGRKVEESGGSEEKERGEEEKEQVDGLPVVRVRKRKAAVVEVEEDDEGEDEHDELDEEAVGGVRKRARHEETGLLVFEGPVSLFLLINFEFINWFLVRPMRDTEGRATVRCRGGRREVRSMRQECLGVLVGRGLEARGPTGGPEEGKVGGREAGSASKNRYEYCSRYIGSY